MKAWEQYERIWARARRKERLREFLLMLRDAGALIVLCMIAWWLGRHW